MVANSRDWDRPGTETTDTFPNDIVDDPTGPIAQPMRLVCVAGEDLGKIFLIGTAPIVLGRGGRCDLCLTTRDVSRRHAMLSIDDGAFVLQDLGSANGTFINGQQLDGKAVLNVGDRVQVGNTILLFTRYDELEARMQQTQRLEAMAVMAGGLAHDFRNALTVILAGLEAFDELVAADSTELRKIANDMRTATTAATELSNRLLNIGRRDRGAYQLVSICKVVDEVASMARHLLGKRISVSITTGKDLRVSGAQEELHQVVMNLLVNAKDAMPDGGKITLVADLAHLDRARSLAYHLPSPGRYVELKITDTGVGMDDATLSRAFEPLFTTKASGIGTGLGLAVTHVIVKRHGGAILAESTLGCGSTFTIYLPIAKP